MGRIIAPYGVRGWIKVHPFTENVDGLLDYDTWWVAPDEGWQAQRWIEGHAHGANLVARLDGYADRDMAARLKGWRIAVPRSVLPPAAAGEYYWADLIGLSVVNRAGAALGQVAEMLETGANDVMVVRGERERLIPFIEPVIVRVELENGTLVVDWEPDY